MKLKNKKTGKIGNFCYGHTNELCVPWQKDDGFWEKQEYNSLAELTEEWEDYEEPKDFWYIDPEVLVACESTNPLLCDKKVAVETMKQIGNYFETEKEAEKAVEKLKAWKRLKDKGFRFILSSEIEMPVFVYSGANGEKCITSAEESKQCRKDIKFLFGGEK